MNSSFADVDEYIKSRPQDVQDILKEIRATIKSKAPGAQESISYGMPAYKMFKKPLIYFAAFEKHIGLYATPTAHKKFASELSKYKQGKGSVQFPMNSPMPLDLIGRIVKFKLDEISKKL